MRGCVVAWLRGGVVAWWRRGGVVLAVRNLGSVHPSLDRTFDYGALSRLLSILLSLRCPSRFLYIYIQGATGGGHLFGFSILPTPVQVLLQSYCNLAILALNKTSLVFNLQFGLRD
jgi:hypothetical protein